MAGPNNGTTQNLSKVVQAGGPVLVDFWAPWCGWCQRLAPGFDRLAAEFSGQVTFVKVNVDEEPLLARQHGVQSLPTLKIFCGGELVEEMIGFLPEQALRRRISQAVREHATCRVPLINA